MRVQVEETPLRWRKLIPIYVPHQPIKNRRGIFGAGIREVVAVIPRLLLAPQSCDLCGHRVVGKSGGVGHPVCQTD